MDFVDEGVWLDEENGVDDDESSFMELWGFYLEKTDLREME